MTELLAGGFAVLAVLAVWVTRSAWFKGKSGEATVHSALRRQLDETGFRILKDLTLPATDGSTQIDHVVISRFGVFVIETKNMQGWIFGSADQTHWTQTLYRRKSRFQNPVRQNYGHVKAVQAALDLDADRIHSVVVFVGSAVPRTAMPPGVVWGAQSLIEHIRMRRLAAFEEGEIGGLADRLAQKRLRPGLLTNRAHVRHVKALAARRQSETAKCPRCGSGMIERTNRKSGEAFLSCSRFPKCRGTREAPRFPA